MNAQEILQKLQNTKKGTYVSLTKIKDLGNDIIKESDMRIRVGVNYKNLKANKNKEIQPLPWGKWVKGLENLVVEHKGNYYLRITSTNPNDLEKASDVIATRYIQNGKEISKEEVINQIGEKKLTSSPSMVYNIKFDNIIRIGN